MTCPSCGQQNLPEARFCGRCGTPLSVAGPASWPAPPAAAAETRFTHPGKVYGLGYGPNFFGIWTLAGGPPVQTFDRTQMGWELAWRWSQELELHDAVPAWRRATVGWVLLDVVVGFVLWFFILIVEAMVLVAAKKQAGQPAR